MSDGVLQELVAELLIAVQGLSGHPGPAPPPTVVLVPHGELERAACTGPCDIYGWFPPGATIYLDDRLDPAASVWARGVLVHELVHYLQQESGAYGGRVDCAAWLRREQEAYRVQIRWLRDQPATGRPMPGLGPPLHHMSCDTGNAAAD